MHKFIFIGAFLLCHLSPAIGQRLPDEIMQCLMDRKELFVRAAIDDLKKQAIFNSLPGFDHLKADSVFLYLGIKDSLFIRNNLHFLDFPVPPSMKNDVLMTDRIEPVLSGKAYPTYSGYLKILNYFRQNYPEECRIDTLGYSVKGKLLPAVRIEPVNRNTNDYPVAFFSSTMHGDETTGYMLMLLLIKELLSSESDLIEELKEKATIIIAPLENPDGTYALSDTSFYGATRGNANGVNLNRNYPDIDGNEFPDGNERQAESKALMDYLSHVRPSLSANFHGGAEVVNYPFDSRRDLHADDEWFRFISREYARLASSLLSGYMDGFDGGITNGYAWYEVHGGRQDYVTYFLRGRETTIELSDTKMIPAAEILTYWTANRESMINYLRQILYGIHGEVADSVSGNPVNAEFILINHDKMNSGVFTNPDNGKFYRLLKAGNYTALIKADNYHNKRIEDIEVKDYQTTNLQIKLLPLSFIPEISDFSIIPNPVLEDFTLHMELESPGEVRFVLRGMTGKLIWNFKKSYDGGIIDEKFTLPGGAGIYYLWIEYKTIQKVFKVIRINP